MRLGAIVKERAREREREREKGGLKLGQMVQNFIWDPERQLDDLMIVLCFFKEGK